MYKLEHEEVLIEFVPIQIKSLKEELAKKASMLSKVKEEKASTGPTGKVRFSPAVTEAKEKEELRKTIRRLEERLRDGDACGRCCVSVYLCCRILQISN